MKRVRLRLRKGRKQANVENQIRRRIFGIKKDENEEYNKLHNKEVYSLYLTYNIVNM